MFMEHRAKSRSLPEQMPKTDTKDILAKHHLECIFAFCVLRHISAITAMVPVGPRQAMG